MKQFNNIRHKQTGINLDAIKEELIESIDDKSIINDIPDFVDGDELFSFVSEGIGVDIAKRLLPKKILHKIKRAANGNKYKMAIAYYRKLKNDKTRQMTNDDMIRISASIAGLRAREFAKVLNKETRYESNQNGQKYREPSIKDTGKVLEDGLPETVKAYCDMTPEQDYETIMKIINKGKSLKSIRESYHRSVTKNLADSGEDRNLSFGMSKGLKPAGIIGFRNINNWFVLFEPDSYDKKELKGMKLKSGEKIYRYVTDTTRITGLMPYIKVNINKGLAYSLTQASSSGEIDETEFETRGQKLQFSRMIG